MGQAALYLAYRGVEENRQKPSKDYNDTYIKSMTILHNFFDRVMVMVQSNAEKKLKKQLSHVCKKRL